MGRITKTWRTSNVICLIYYCMCLSESFQFCITVHFTFFILIFFVLTGFMFCLSAPEFDVSELEKLFSANVPKPADSSKTGGRRKSVGSKTDKVHLVLFYMSIIEFCFMK